MASLQRMEGLLPLFDRCFALDLRAYGEIHGVREVEQP
jgi:hypothetical protein